MLDGEEHARPQLGTGAGAARVDDFRAVVEQAPDAVPAEIAHNAVAVGFGMALDGVGNVAEAVAGPGLLEPEHQAFVSNVDQLLRFDRDVADEVLRLCRRARRFRIGSRPGDDIAVLERLVAGNAVANDMLIATQQLLV